jgi:hypothetical protein
MANEFSIAIHNYISDELAATEKYKKDAEKENDLASTRYHEGQLQELNTIRQYMVKKIDLKTQKYY